MKVLMNLSSLVFLACALIYCIGFFRFHAELKRDQGLWVEAGQPDLLDLNGQAKVIALIFQVSRRGDVDVGLQRRAQILRGLLIAGLVSFAVMVGLAVALY